MPLVTHQISSVSDLIEILRKDFLPPTITWYRGHSNSSWGLVPSIARNPVHLQAELTAIKMFKQNAWTHLKDRPSDEWEWMFLMQHHRAPTRLLDWSESPLIGLFFAVEGQDQLGEEGALWLLNPVSLNRQSGHRRAFDLDILAFGADAELEQYVPEQVNARRVMLDPVAIIGPRNSARMVAQSGTFTIMHANPKPIEQLGDAGHVQKVLIPANAKARIHTELRLLGITEYSVYPDLDRLSALARSLFQ